MGRSGMVGYCRLISTFLTFGEKRVDFQESTLFLLIRIVNLRLRLRLNMHLREVACLWG